MTPSLKNKMPAWDFRSSYGGLTSQAYRKARQRLEADIHILSGLVPNAKDAVSISIALEHLAEVFSLTDSLIGYCRCLSAIDTREQEAAKERVRLWEIHSRYYELITGLFHRLTELKKSDPIWKELDFSKWEWLFERVSSRWSFSLSPRTLQLLYELKASNFVPCSDLYHSVNSHLVATVRTMDGLTKHQSHSQCIAVLKTSEDPKLRQSTFAALNEYYSQNAYLYASIFNMLTGFRLKGFEFAQMDFMAPAYWQNAVSSEAVDALMTAVRANRHMLRKSVISRALFTGRSAMDVWDLNAPAPLRREIHIPYEEALDKIKEVGKVLDERIPETFELFVEKGWVEVRQLPGKQNGAFFQGILSLNEPRIFSTYLGSFASMSQQAIMYGHAWHFWLQRELPAQERKIPRALMEVAGHFFALLLFEEIQEKAASTEEKLEALWQELTFISNYVINMGVRFDFERSFFEERRKGVLSVTKISNLLSEAWQAWYGESTAGIDPYLWINRGQFYKIDDYFYNYPYIFGTVCAYGLSEIRHRMPEVFLKIYSDFLFNSGRMSVDDLFKKFFKIDITQPEFWESGLKAMERKISVFEAEARKYSEKAVMENT